MSFGKNDKSNFNAVGSFRQHAASVTKSKYTNPYTVAPTPDFETPPKEDKPTSDYRFKFVPKTDKKPHELLNEGERKMGGKLTENSLSKEQREVFDTMSKWYERKESDLLKVGGYAGTGKSTLLSVFANKYLDVQAAFCAFTGKATSVLRKKFYEANIVKGAFDIGTLHSLIYYPIPNEKTGGIRGWKKRQRLPYDLIVVDEASMLNEELFTDLQSYGIPILAVGDHGQLPPVFGSFSLMDKPHLKLETIHRQAEDSPILALSEFVRRTGQVPRMADCEEVQVLEHNQVNEVVQKLFTAPGVRYDDVAMLCYKNETRVDLNNRARVTRWESSWADPPQVDDQVICLRNTDATIFNGMRGTIQEIEESARYVYEGRVLFEDDEIEVSGSISAPQLGHPTTFKDFNEYHAATGHRPNNWSQVGLLLDYGYALTCHKAQGSQFEHVVVVAEKPNRISYDDWKRWIYTAITRCSKYLVVLQ
jgi:exodeoxyribonuclease-5